MRTASLFSAEFLSKGQKRLDKSHMGNYTNKRIFKILDKGIIAPSSSSHVITLLYKKYVDTIIPPISKRKQLVKVHKKGFKSFQVPASIHGNVIFAEHGRIGGFYNCKAK